MKSKPRSRGTILFAAICWTLTTILWGVTVSLRVSGGYLSGLLFLQIAVLLLSLINAILNWLRHARYREDNN